MPAYRAGRVGIVAKVDRAQDGFPKIYRVVKRPQRRLERAHDVTGTNRQIPPITSTSYFLDLGMEVLAAQVRSYELGSEHVVARKPVQQSAENDSHVRDAEMHCGLACVGMLDSVRRNSNWSCRSGNKCM